MSARSAAVVTIIVNWRQPTLTLRAVNAALAQSFPTDVVVVDNDSQDESLDALAAIESERVRLIASSSNRGFGGGCNLGMAASLAASYQYVWLVNNDAVPQVDCLELMLDEFSKQPCIGCVGAKLVDPEGASPVHAGFIMKGRTLECVSTCDALELNNAAYAWLSGACLLLRADVLEEVGLFDSDFFMYWEDADLCQRIRERGYRLAVASQAQVTHSPGTSSQSMTSDRYLWHLDSQSIWIRKHHSSRVLGTTVMYGRHLLKALLSGDQARLRSTSRHAVSRLAKRQGGEGADLRRTN